MFSIGKVSELSSDEDTVGISSGGVGSEDIGGSSGMAGTSFSSIEVSVIGTLCGGTVSSVLADEINGGFDISELIVEDGTAEVVCGTRLEDTAEVLIGGTMGAVGNETDEPVLDIELIVVLSLEKETAAVLSPEEVLSETSFSLKPISKDGSRS